MFEREEIRAGLERNESLTELSRRLSRHRCTVSAEVNRNGGRYLYRAVDAQARADRQRARPKTPILAKDLLLATYVTRQAGSEGLADDHLQGTGGGSARGDLEDLP